MKHPAWPLLGAAIAIIAGGAVFAAAEHVSFGLGLWWALVTAATVGYGDVVPHNTPGRVVGAVVILTAIPLLGMAWSRITSRPAHGEAAAARRIAADLFKHHTGTDHPDAPGGAREESR